ncbi:spinster family MFS transporter [Sphingomonas jatrophae]|nr:MFS transporter [Sphingomonas jatrophae]
MLKASLAPEAGALSEPVVESRTPAADRGGWRRTLMLAMMTLIYALNYLDRQVVVILQEPIKADYKLLDWQLGLLTGASISLLYTAMSIPIARWVDRGLHRVRLIATITALWSILTAACGLTRSFGQFIVARMGVGMAEAGFTPAAHSLLSDLYPVRKRPWAMGIFSLGISIGIMTGMAVGGFVAQRYDWRTALMVVGLPGIVVAAAFALLAREPARGESEVGTAVVDKVEPMKFGVAVKALWRRPAYVHVVLGSAAASFASTAIFSWVPSLLIRVHGMSLAEVGLGLGLLSGLSGLIGTSLGGWQAARFGARGLHAMLWAPIGGLALSIPLFIAAFYASSGQATLITMFAPLVLVALWTAPSIALTQSLAPLAARATASAVYIVTANVLGVALGPIVIGLLSDIFTRSTGNTGTGLRWALTVAALIFAWSILHWSLALRALKRMPAAA